MEEQLIRENQGNVNFFWFCFQAKLRDKPSLEGHVLLKKLRDALELMKGCITGINKDEVEQAISLVSRLYFK